MFPLAVGGKREKKRNGLTEKWGITAVLFDQ